MFRLDKWLLLLHGIKLVILHFYLLQFSTASSNTKKFCVGTNFKGWERFERLYSPGCNNYYKYQYEHEKCTHIVGNLEIISTQNDDTFLQHIEEITGYLLVANVWYQKLTFPRLRIIRGQSLFRVNQDDPGYALLVMDSEFGDLTFPALREISNGSVGVYTKNRRMWYLETINWKDILEESGAQFHYYPHFDDHYKIYKPKPDSSVVTTCIQCKLGSVGGCWGEGMEQCQQISKRCDKKCGGGRCFGPGPSQCCHNLCSAGCNGTSAKDCFSCKSIYHDGQCKEKCPRDMLSFGSSCVYSCPKNTFLNEEEWACVSKCPSDKLPEEGKCKRLLLSEKMCRHPSDIWPFIHSGNIDYFRNCTFLDGNIYIDQRIFSNSRFNHNLTFIKNQSPVSPNKLEIFSSIKEITGTVQIRGSLSSFYGSPYLKCFRNLEVIGTYTAPCRPLYNYDSLVITDSDFETVEFGSLREIQGPVFIELNPKLCYVDSVNWGAITGKEFISRVEFNQDVKNCTSKNHSCSQDCAGRGCWSPHDCVCLDFRLEGRCVAQCNLEGDLVADGRTCVGTCPVGKYQEEGVCRRCHEYCEGGCTGSTNVLGQCGCNSCRYMKAFHSNGTVECLRKGMDCPVGYITVSQDAQRPQSVSCIQCYEHCEGGCTGSLAILGEFGCKSCRQATIYDNGTIKCMKKGTSCPAGYFLTAVAPNEKSEIKLPIGTPICKRCHSLCSRCTAYGNEAQICQECTHYRHDDICVETCPSELYGDKKKNKCIPCAGPYIKCLKSSIESCELCTLQRKYKDKDNGGINATFSCVLECSTDLVETTAPVPETEFFSAIIAQPTLLIICVCAVVGAIVIILVIGIGVCCRSTQRNFQNMDKSISLALLDKSKLTAANDIRRDEVIGSGGYAKVYRGAWMPQDGSQEIPVAIKILRGTSGAMQPESFVAQIFHLTSLEHPHILQLLSFCLKTSEIMLVTKLMPLGCLRNYLRENEGQISSNTMLAWCVQIAEGMEYLENQDIVHGDLAARNIMMESPFSVKITDFGLAKLLRLRKEQTQVAKLSIQWLAPECFHGKDLSHKSDVWAFGIIVWEILTYGKDPYDGVPIKDFATALEGGQCLENPQTCSLELRMILLKTWMTDPEDRPSFNEVVERLSVMCQDPGHYIRIPGEQRGSICTISSSFNGIYSEIV